MSDVLERRLAEALRELADQQPLSESELREALGRVLDAGRLQALRAKPVFTSLADTLLDELDLHGSVPRAVVEQAHRLAARRRKLVAGGAWSVADLAEAKGQDRNAIHTWLSRQRDAYRLFTVPQGREVFVPALLLDEAAEPLPGSEGAIRPLAEAGMDGWAMWVWFDAAAAALDGRRPADLLAKGEHQTLRAAAEQQAANAATATPERSVAA